MQELNYWTELSIQYANQKSYLDDLFQVYTFSKKNQKVKTETEYSLKKWINRKVLGILPIRFEDFVSNNENAILENERDNYSKFCKNYLDLNNFNKLDLIARFNGKYILIKAKLLMGFEYEKNEQLNDIINFLEVPIIREDIKKVVILDSYVSTKEIYKKMITKTTNSNLMSILVLREFLYQVYTQ